MRYSIYTIIAVLAGIITFVEFFRPQTYKVTNKNIIINRKIRNKLIAINQIEDIKELNYLPPLSFIRLFGFGAGPFAPIVGFGLFWSLKYGLMHVYITSRKNLILIILKNKKKYLISPKEEDKVLIENIFNKYKS